MSETYPHRWEELDIEEDDGCCEPGDYCPTCNGEGEIIICPDDLCRGAGYCMHGDGYAPCPDCTAKEPTCDHQEPTVATSAAERSS